MATFKSSQALIQRWACDQDLGPAIESSDNSSNLFRVNTLYFPQKKYKKAYPKLGKQKTFKLSVKPKSFHRLYIFSAVLVIVDVIYVISIVALAISKILSYNERNVALRFLIILFPVLDATGAAAFFRLGRHRRRQFQRELAALDIEIIRGDIDGEIDAIIRLADATQKSRTEPNSEILSRRFNIDIPISTDSSEIAFSLSPFDG